MGKADRLSGCANPGGFHYFVILLRSRPAIPKVAVTCAQGRYGYAELRVWRTLNATAASQCWDWSGERPSMYASHTGAGSRWQFVDQSGCGLLLLLHHGKLEVPSRPHILIGTSGVQLPRQPPRLFMGPKLLASSRFPSSLVDVNSPT